MRKTILIIVTVLSLAVLLAAQTHTFPALDTNNAFTGNNTHSGTETFANITSASANPATSGLLRVAPGDQLCWENAALNNTICLGRLSNSIPFDGLNLPYVSGYFGTQTSGVGLITVDGTLIDSLAQGVNISPTPLINVPANAGSGQQNPGMWRITAYIIVTQAATVSSTLPSIVITWTDQNNNTSQTFTLTPTNAGNTLTTFQQASMAVSPKGITNINFSTTGYATNGATSMQYAVHVRTEAM